MATAPDQVNLQARIDSLRDQTGGMVSIDEIGQTVNGLLNSVSGHEDMDLAQIGAELSAMLDSISRARDELTMMRPRAVSQHDIPVATDELDAVVEHTESAAGKIMDAADRIVDVAGSVEGEASEKLMEISTEIFEASSFQDLTGQRVTKVVGILKQLEERLTALADAIGDQSQPDVESEAVDAQGNVLDESALQNGPQLDGEGNNQDDIDALLASFD